MELKKRNLVKEFVVTTPDNTAIPKLFSPSLYAELDAEFD